MVLAKFFLIENGIDSNYSQVLIQEHCCLSECLFFILPLGVAKVVKIPTCKGFKESPHHDLLVFFCTLAPINCVKMDQKGQRYNLVDHFLSHIK